MFTPKCRDEEGTFIKIPMAEKCYNMCRERVVALAKEAQAYIKYGNVVLINVKKCDEYLIKEYTE